MTQLEKEIERRLRQTVEKHGGLCLKWVCPGWSGVPDRIVLLPGGRIIFVELKQARSGRLSAMQKWWAKKLVELGFRWESIWAWEGVDIFENLYLKDL